MAEVCLFFWEEKGCVLPQPGDLSNGGSKEGIKIHGPRKPGMEWSVLSDGEARASHKLSVFIMDY